MTEERRKPESDDAGKRELEREVEELTGRLATLVNTAGAGLRDEMREYAVGLLKEETEVAEAPPARESSTDAANTNPIGIAVLLFVVSLPLFLLFAPVGLVIMAIAGVLGIWGVLQTIFRR